MVPKATAVAASGVPVPGERPGSHRDPSKALPVLGPARGPQGEVLCVPPRPSSQQQGSPFHAERDATWPPQERCTHPPFLCMPMGTKLQNKSFPSLARSPQPLAFRRSRQTCMTVSKTHVAEQTHLLEPRKEWAMTVPALEATNSFTSGYNSAAMCLSLKKRNLPAGYFSGSAAILFKFRPRYCFFF